MQFVLLGVQLQTTHKEVFPFGSSSSENMYTFLFDSGMLWEQ